MGEPFIFLRSEITRENAWDLIRWLEDEEVIRYLSDSRDTAAQIAEVLDRVNLPVLTHLFSQNGRFYLVYDRRHKPVGFVRLIMKSGETEIVVVIGDQTNWGKRLGTNTIRESLKTAFFELRSSKVVAKIHRENLRSVRAFLHAGFRLETETPSFQKYGITMKEYLALAQKKHVKSSGIYMTQLDKERLKKLIDDKVQGTALDRSLFDLHQEINRAEIVGIDQIAPDVVTMNSRMLLHVDGEDMEVSLVYPEEADWSENRLSILSPVGTAILGYGEGEDIRWEVPSGTAAIQIKKVLYQPEAAGDFHL